MNERGISWRVYQSDVAAAFSTASFLVDSIGKVGAWMTSPPTRAAAGCLTSPLSIRRS